MDHPVDLQLRCQNPEDLPQWFQRVYPFLRNNKRVVSGLRRAVAQLLQALPLVQDALLGVKTQLGCFDFLPDDASFVGMAQDARRMVTNMLNMLERLRRKFALFPEQSKTSKETLSSHFVHLKREMQDIYPKNPVDATASSASLALAIHHSLMLDVFAASTRLTIDLRMFAQETPPPLPLVETLETGIQQARFEFGVKDRSLSDFCTARIDVVKYDDFLKPNLSEIPVYLDRIFTFLYRTGYATTGIFRLNGSMDTAKLYARYPLMIEFAEKNVINIAASLKFFFQQLEPPLIPTKIAAALVQATREFDEETCARTKHVVYEPAPIMANPHLAPLTTDDTPLAKFVNTVKAQLSLVPILPAILRNFVELAIKIANGPSMMTINGLAICLGPCILPPRGSSADLAESGIASMFFEEITLNAPLVFNSNAPIFGEKRGFCPKPTDTPRDPAAFLGKRTHQPPQPPPRPTPAPPPLPPPRARTRVLRSPATPPAPLLLLNAPSGEKRGPSRLSCSERSDVCSTAESTFLSPTPQAPPMFV